MPAAIGDSLSPETTDQKSQVMSGAKSDRTIPAPSERVEHKHPPAPSKSRAALGRYLLAEPALMRASVAGTVRLAVVGAAVGSVNNRCTLSATAARAEGLDAVCALPASEGGLSLCPVLTWRTGRSMPLATAGNFKLDLPVSFS